MPYAIAAREQNVAGLQLWNHVGGDGRITFGAQTPDQDVGVRVVVGLGFGQLTPIDQRLHIRVVAAAKRHFRALKVVNPRVTRMHPMAVAAWVDQERCNGAVGLLLGRNGREPDDDVGFFDHALEHGRRVVCVGRVTFKQLPCRHHDLVRGLASATAPAHAIGNDAQHTAVMTLMGDEGDLILLVFTVTLVDASGRDEAKRFGHGNDCEGACSNARRVIAVKRVLSARLWHFRHAIRLRVLKALLHSATEILRSNAPDCALGVSGAGHDPLRAPLIHHCPQRRGSGRWAVSLPRQRRMVRGGVFLCFECALAPLDRLC